LHKESHQEGKPSPSKKDFGQRGAERDRQGARGGNIVVLMLAKEKGKERKQKDSFLKAAGSEGKVRAVNR